jgi:histidine triad (HIT) family protein
VTDTCVFCDIVAGIADTTPKHYGDVGDSVIFEPLNPVTPGHLLVAPKRHVRDAAEDPLATAGVMRAASVLAGTWSAANIITSIGAVATQSIFHLHIHVVPRRPDDGLALPWTGQKLSAPTHLDGEQQ